MMMEVEGIFIRTAREEDFMAMAKLAAKCSPMALERNSIYHIFTTFFQNTVFVAEFQGIETDITNKNRLIGFLLGFKSQSNPEEAYIHLLCIDPKYRRKGIAPMLIKKFLKVVNDMGCKRVSLITKPINKRAIDFYEKLGFQKNIGFKTLNIKGINVVKDYNGTGEHMVVFQKIISE
jgi:ribosomal protein S18 acetylase RimI-like enzyme